MARFWPGSHPSPPPLPPHHSTPRILQQKHDQILGAWLTYCMPFAATAQLVGVHNGVHISCTNFSSRMDNNDCYATLRYVTVTE